MSNLIALDVGDVRVGVAIANKTARLPRPLTTLKRGERFWGQLDELLANHSADVVVVGVPRSLEGNDTKQTKATWTFIRELEKHIDLPVETTDEALTSQQAEAEIKRRGKNYAREDIDALAASLILDDYLSATSQTEYENV